MPDRVRMRSSNRSRFAALHMAAIGNQADMNRVSAFWSLMEVKRKCCARLEPFRF